MSRLVSWCLAIAVVSCGKSHEERPRLPPSAARVSPAATRPTPAVQVSPEESCETKLARSRELPALPGIPALDTERSRIFARAKAEPVLFVRAPFHEKTDDLWVRSHRRVLERARYPWGTLAAMLPKLAHDRARARLVLLREGYVFAEEPELAFALSDQLKLDELFSGERVWVARGELVLHAERNEQRRYVWSDGPEQGKPARLLLFDRVGIAGEPAPGALHRDLRGLRNRLHFDQMRVLRLTELSIEAELRYGPIWIKTLLTTEGARVELACESTSSAQASLLRAHRERGERALRAVQALREVIREEVDEAIPFDEPITEVGQQDGKLRVQWRHAFLSGANEFRFNSDRYRVFDERGRPLAPQVCFDFLMDTLERASGTRWLGRDEPRGRHIGRLDFDTFDRDALRSADKFLAFVAARPDWFDVYSVPESERIEMGDERRLVEYLSSTPDRFIPGDILVIFGWTPWDPYDRHYHSVFVYETDPLTGFPMLIAGNAGRPTVRTWHTECVRTPRRYLIRRIRPRLEWLERVVDPRRGQDRAPAFIVGGS